MARRLRVLEGAAHGLRLLAVNTNNVSNSRHGGEWPAMQIAPTSTFRGFRPSNALQGELGERIDKLGTIFPRLVACRTVMELVHRHVRGNHFHVRIELSVPGRHIVVAHEARLRASGRSDADPEHKSAHLAVRDAFDIATRRLQERARRLE